MLQYSHKSSGGSVVALAAPAPLNCWFGILEKRTVLFWKDENIVAKCAKYIICCKVSSKPRHLLKCLCIAEGSPPNFRLSWWLQFEESGTQKYNQSIYTNQTAMFFRNKLVEIALTNQPIYTPTKQPCFAEKIGWSSANQPVNLHQPTRFNYIFSL